MLWRSFSPTKLSRAITSETEIGKKPTTINKKGIKRSATIGASYFWTKFTAWRAVKFISDGKTSVNVTTGKMMRQSRSWSRTSRRVMTSAIRSDALQLCNMRGLFVVHRVDSLQIDLLQAARHCLQGDHRQTLGN